METTFKRAASHVQQPFVNEPLTDFSKEENKRAQAEALEQVKSELGRTYPLIIGGKQIESEHTFASVNPSQPDQIIGHFARATEEQTKEAITTAATTFETWKRVPAEDRANYLFAAADIMRHRRFYLAAWMIYEVGKSWGEADGDIAEAIDFLEFYAREMLRLAEEQPIVRMEGEDNQLVYIPLGVCAVIPPWNFPCAIMAGMTCAALVAGNTVVLKPASTAPTVAAQFMRILQEVGLPAGVVNFLTGSGSVIGDTLVDDARVRLIAFTGSRDVGLRIYERAAKRQQG
ncbi:MAG: aldehyde dehydrogenase family protein, partial [Ktedonobacteraceae bacterium]|nr:aldehyde dehydrogenase family protein [Ktedonobacteraceae bacterium]